MVGGGLLDYIVSFLGQVIVIVISRPGSLIILIIQICEYQGDLIDEDTSLSREAEYARDASKVLLLRE